MSQTERVLCVLAALDASRHGSPAKKQVRITDGAVQGGEQWGSGDGWTENYG
jgi:hypothetical protein